MKNNFMLSLAVFISFLYVNNICAQTVPEILYYKFDGVGTTVPNEASSPPGGAANIVGGLTQGSTGLCGGALIGVGGASSSNIVNTGWNTNLGNNPWTIAFWTNNIPNTTTLYYQFGDAGAGTLRCFNNGVAGAGNWMLRGPLTDVVCTGCAPVGAIPSMATFVYDPVLGNIKAYHNGNLVSTVAQSVLSINGTGFTIGGTSGTGLGAGQLMDEFRVYDRALDASEVFDTYNACLPLWSVPNDVGVQSIDAPFAFCADTNDVIVTIKNFGNNIVDSCIVHWEINSVPQTPFYYYGTLDTAGGVGLQSAQVTLGSAYFAPFVPYTIDAWTQFPNGIQDTVTSNDSSSVVTQSSLSGIFTIGGATPDYIDFNAANADLSAYGVCGPVVFNVEDGVYNEQITIGEYVGMSATNTVTFQSLNADPLLVNLTYAGTGTGDNFVVSMDGGDYFSFKNMTISNTGTTYGRVIQVQNGSTNNTWAGNIITGDMNVTTSSTNMALVYSSSGSSIDSSNVYDGNDFMYGSYAFYYYGNGSTDLENGTVITNNTITNFYYRGLNMYYQSDLEISNNTIIPGDVYTSSIYRIYMYYAGGAIRVNNNKLEGDKYGYGIYMSNCDAWVTDPGYVYNNFIHIGNPTVTSTSYGIYMTGCDNQKIKYNSVNMESLGTNSRSIYVTSGAEIDVKNNVFMNSGPGYGMYFNSGVSESNNNNIYVPNGTPFYSGGAIADLATWQATTGFDMMSDTLDPMFLTADDLHTCQDLSLDGGAEPDTMIIYDIDGQLRDVNTPDIGADEFLGLANLAFASDTIWKCSTGTVDLGGWEPTDGATYLWSTTESTPSIVASNTGNYSVIVTTSCGTTMPSVLVQNIPDAVADFSTQISFMTAACTNNSYGTIDTYSWDFGDGFTTSELNPTHLYSDTGMFIITLTVTGPCGTDVLTDTMYASTVGIDENILSNSLVVYPNPNNGAFAVDFNLDHTAEVSIALLNPQGQSVWNTELGMVQGTQTESVDLTGTSTGIYFLQITVDGETAIRKIIVE